MNSNNITYFFYESYKEFDMLLADNPEESFVFICSDW